MRAAAAVFAERGFHAATVPQLAERAGVSTGLLYRYFPGKAALAAAIVEADRQASVTAIRDHVLAHADASAALARLVEGWLEQALSDRLGCALAVEIGAEATRDASIGRVVADYDDALLGLVVDVVRRARPDIDAAATATWLLAALDGLTLRIAVDPAFDPWPAGQALLASLAATSADPTGTTAREG